MAESTSILFLDAQSKDTEYRITSFGDTFLDLLKDYLDWMKKEGLKQEDMWYADFFEHIDDKNVHLGSVVITGEDTYEIVPPDKPHKINPYKRHMSFRQWWQLKTNRL